MDESLPSRWRLGPAAIIAATVLFFVWYAAASAPKPATVIPPDSAIPVGATADLYPLLARGFLKHHLYLDAEVPAGLVRAPDPYTRRPTPHLHDASLFRGRYYMYFGPAPAVVLFLPFRAITGRDLTSPAAVAVFSLLAYAGLIALFAAAAGSGFPWRKNSLAAAVLITLGGSSFLFPLLRRPAFYEVAIAAGSCFFLWSFSFLLRLPRAKRPIARAALAGVLLGLAAACRPTYFLCLAPLAAGIVLLKRERSPGGRALDLVAAVSVFGAVGGLIGLYNYLRFGNPFEFGDKYQLSAGRGLAHFSFRQIPFQAKVYLWSTLGFSRYFPFLRFVPPSALPSGYLGNEYAFGVLTNLPVAVFGAGGLGCVLSRPGEPTRGAILLLLGAIACTLFPLLLFLGSAVRYMADFAPAMAVIAGLGIWRLTALAGRFRPASSKWISTVALLSAAASFAVVFLASVDMYDVSFARPPPAFDRLGNVLDRPVVGWDWWRGIRYGPRRLEILLPNKASGREALVTAAGPAGAWDGVGIEYAGRRAIRFFFCRDGFDPLDRSLPIPIERDRTHRIALSMGALLPLRPGELLQPLPPSRFAARRTWLAVELDGRVVWETPIEPRPERFNRIRTGTGQGPPGATGFSGRILSQAVLPAGAIALDRPAIAGVGLGLNLTSVMAGRSFPLASTGRDGSGNILLLAVGRNGKIRLGYDHWGKDTLWSDEIKAAVPSFHRLEFWLPSILNRTPPTALIVSWDGRAVWKESVPYFIATRQEIYLGRNPIGGSGCEPSLINSEIESINLAFPPAMPR